MLCMGIWRSGGVFSLADQVPISTRIRAVTWGRWGMQRAPAGGPRCRMTRGRSGDGDGFMCLPERARAARGRLGTRYRRRRTCLHVRARNGQGRAEEAPPPPPPRDHRGRASSSRHAPAQERGGWAGGQGRDRTEGHRLPSLGHCEGAQADQSASGPGRKIEDFELFDWQRRGRRERRGHLHSPFISSSSAECFGRGCWLAGWGPPLEGECLSGCCALAGR